MKRLLLVTLLACSVPLWGDAFTFSTGGPNNLMAVSTRPDSSGKFEIEAADDFLLGTQTKITSATFYGLLTGGATISDIGQVVIEMYRVFPLDSNTVRTPNVPTRTNSPSDVAFASKDSAAGDLNFIGATVDSTFTVLNSIQAGGIHKQPNQTTGGNGAVTGLEVAITVTFATPFDLPADHYFFVPQVELSGSTQNFYWLSGSRPISGFGTTPFAPDLQMWTRDAGLDPDWLRVGTDIVGGATPPTFNGAFSLSGETAAVTSVPEPASMALVLGGLAGVWSRRKKRS